MIDTKELREKITIKGLDVVADTDILVVLDRLEAWENVFGHLGTPDEVGNEWRALSDRLEAAESECLEQARLNGMGSEREAALAARLEATEEDRARFLVEMGRLCAQCDALRLRIKAAEKERDALRAELDALKSQEPVAWLIDWADEPDLGHYFSESAVDEDSGRSRPLFLHPVPASVPEGWQLVPIEPTQEMLDATSWPNCAGTDYKKMLAAAPRSEAKP